MSREASGLNVQQARVFYDTGPRVRVVETNEGKFMLTVGEMEIDMDEKLAVRVIMALQETLAARNRQDPRD